MCVCVWLCVATLESMDVVERFAEDTIIVHQLLKRVWPSTQREIVFLSALRTLPPRCPDEQGDGYVVCNVSVDHPAAPVRHATIKTVHELWTLSRMMSCPPKHGARRRMTTQSGKGPLLIRSLRS